MDTAIIEKHERMKWWREARFGMFIHWGLYSVLAGEWQGQKTDYIGEWIMNKYKIPIREYEKIAKQFNPAGFDADAWVSLAKKAGMKYLVFTAKHHDGFAMYHSKADPYNIVDATGFGRDPIAELAAACKKYDVRLCLYYSQALDWHEKDAGGIGFYNSRNYHGVNDWDFPDHSVKDFARYFENKVKPQVKELLTQYGPISAIWFDTPFTITREQCQELYNFVRQFQGDCIMNSRLGHGLGDYKSLGDNEIPTARLGGDWETIATMNDTWGYKWFDHNWKTANGIITLLTGLAGKGVNYVLNVGPTAEGLFPEQSIKILEEIGDWMAINNESVYNTMPSPFIGNLSWGSVTTKPGKLYFHLHKWPGSKISLSGLHNQVTKAYLLSNKENTLKVTQEYNKELDLHSLELILPEAAEKENIPVAVLELSGDVNIEKGLFQQPDGVVHLISAEAKTNYQNSQHGSPGAADGAKISAEGEIVSTNDNMIISPAGAAINWFDTKGQ